MIRIIAGKHKKRKLFSVPGLTTRPTTDFNREMIFSTYQDFEGKRILDLFAGTGAFGLEALSRGAIWVDFVEFANSAIATILKNTTLLSCTDSCHIYRKRVEAYLKDCSYTYDVIFLDPPYDKNLINPTLQSIMKGNILNPGGVIIAEHSRKEKPADDLCKYIFKQKEGNTCSFSWLSV
ncbi:MAG: 16S rRNA (guanine(966)-N(2))-methyltransferase RsmD [Candidatus Cloacimonetes bacterium]|jgi:16S rRNA (guanine966-N2)-methyltransferase|nr:16S rRNA (guanine(966)-N(2))-methyltransferase RsmD [Candidatus Cloacimonadota bacterium]MDD2209820.1 16S rRNA (guanine(966)-N(2))-methyltransferase RsmD [Candidatus Cloacimonadota bacterium]MDD4231329.1 16S rRNA (guanine(966)-N(2))-methyltransferase RsmD [Candidatus Cloacimonadota bacterium]MDD4686577.1 16S rRNA (guanine(966)-N(2))-methyltransferase RsmD [Candidatus Cloacimonadota bacterium]MDY0298256.1 16S rRNA (guanine(966)-N(2))-methyltransferase RsmD [Candidatus Cloacimonadaceae bacteri